MERLQDARQRDRAAVRVGDDPVARESLERPAAVHLGDDERIAVDEPVRGGLVDAEGAGRGRDRNELPARGRTDREEEEIDVAGAERLGRRLLDDELVVAVRHARARRAGRRERADVLVAALGQELERHRADRPGRADDSDAGLPVHHCICSSRYPRLPAVSRVDISTAGRSLARS